MLLNLREELLVLGPLTKETLLKLLVLRFHLPDQVLLCFDGVFELLDNLLILFEGTLLLLRLREQRLVLPFGQQLRPQFVDLSAKLRVLLNYILRFLRNLIQAILELSY